MAIVLDLAELDGANSCSLPLRRHMMCKCLVYASQLAMCQTYNNQGSSL